MIDLQVNVVSSEVQLAMQVGGLTVIQQGSGGGEVEQGPPGKSAYEVAVANGFVGTEPQWLESLKVKGDDGLSAYRVAVANGYEGTEAEWLASLEGKDADLASLPDAGALAAANLLPVLQGGTAGLTTLTKLAAAIQAIIGGVTPPPDTDAPVMGGTIVPSNITQTGFTLSGWSATDNVGVVGFEVSTDGGATRTDIGNVSNYNATGKVADTSYTCQVWGYDAAGNRSQPLSIIVKTAAAPVQSGDGTSVRSLWTGLPTTDGIHVSARMNSDKTANTSRLVVSLNSDLSNPIKTASVAPDPAYRIAKHTAAGLLSDTEYFYAVEVDGVVDLATKGRFKTLPPAGPANFTVALGCCSNNLTHSDKAWAAIRDARPHAFILLGDWTYSNASYTAEADRIGQYDNCLTNPAIRQQVHTTVPTAYIWDDHDFGPDNATGLDDSNQPQAWRQASIDAYRRRSPNPLLSNTQTDTVDHSFVIGRVRFIVSDLRADRSGIGMADSASKSMMGAAQKARWKAQITAAKNAGQAVCWISSVPWIAGAAGGTGGGVGGDHWGAFATERLELANYIRDEGMGGKVMVICGDMHAMALHTGFDYAYPVGGATTPVFQVGAMHSAFTSIKGGPYTQGPFGLNGVQTADGATPTNYGLMSVIDDGTNLTVVWEGFDATAGVRRINHRFAPFGTVQQEPLAPAKPAAPTAVAGNASAVVTVAEPPSNTYPAVTGITVESDAGGVDTDAGTMELAHDITGLANDVPVKFRVKYTNSVGDSPWSDWSSTTVMPTAGGGTIPPSTLQLTGGTVTIEDGWEVHTFTSSADMVVTQAGEGEYFAAGGGGSGGASGTGTGGGGGAGEPKQGVMTFPVGTHPVVIGQGGASVSNTTVGNNGTDTTVGSLITAKAGGGGGSSTTAGKNGASGGGAGASSSSSARGLGTAGQGHDGGLGNGHADNLRASGGGGGATSAGQNGSVDPNGVSGKGGDGGDGVTVRGKEYCGGGGGCGRNGGAVGQGKARGGRGGNSVIGAALPGADNSGSGGGGTTSSVASGKGGSGIFMVWKKL